LVSVIELVPVLVTEPGLPVRNAMVGVRAGLRAAVMLMFPVFVPFNAPMRRVLADIRFISAAVSESFPTESVPKSITLLLVCGARVTDPAGAAILTAVLRVMLSACNKTFPLFEVIECVFTNVPAWYVTSPELVTSAPAVAVSMFEVEPTTRFPTEVVEPASGNV
jgi:hypothetical protein